MESPFSHSKILLAIFCHKQPASNKCSLLSYNYLHLCFLTFLILLTQLEVQVDANRLHHVRHENHRQRRQFFFPQNITLGLNTSVRESGPWGQWTTSSECSRSCGGGVAYQSRICLDINRLDGSYSCTGPSKRYYSCNVQDCPDAERRDFREEQCARFNTLPFEGKYYSWIPYNKAANPCELNCLPKGERFYYRHARKVIDGTRCYNDDSLDICVDGICMPVGCDKLLGSKDIEDKCRVCGGDGSSCRTVEGVFDQDQLQVGYNDIILIPAGATNIKISERHATNNYLAVRNLQGEFYMNGNWKIQFPSEMKFAGSTFHYERKPHGVLAPESLRALGPITQALFIVLLYQEPNKGIHYEYSIPAGIQSHALTATYNWVVADYGPCTRTCGSGLQLRNVHCSRAADQESVEDHLCDLTSKPATNRTCNSEPCPAGWFIGEWSNCSCHHSVQNRLVYCRIGDDQGNEVIADDSNCYTTEDSIKPASVKSCVSSEKVCAMWISGEWDKCDALICGEGKTSRNVTCIQNGEPVDESKCDAFTKPKTTRVCVDEACEGVEWVESEWSNCGTKCTSKIQTRTVLCTNMSGSVVPDEACNSKVMPERQKACPDMPPCPGVWLTSEWSQCSSSCGEGVQTRIVFCGIQSASGEVTTTEEDNCSDQKPQDVSVCKGKETECEGFWATGPWHRCNVPCGGGERSRLVFCMNKNNEIMADNKCDPSNKPENKDKCNEEACDDDSLKALEACKDTPFGCCADGSSIAGQDYTDCPPIELATLTNGCKDNEFGCCKDSQTAAFGPFLQGCPIICNFTRFGCCRDGNTPANSSDILNGCPDFNECEFSMYGCCEDNVTIAGGVDFEGCPVSTTTMMPTTTEAMIERSETVGSLICEGSGEGSGDECIVACKETEFGCCPDGFTAATGKNFVGCEEGSGGVTDDSNCTDASCIDSSPGFENCTGTEFGCCPDGKTVATGERYYGCTCENFPHGCCQDKYTPARGPNYDGCVCSRMVYGCCSDGVTPAIGQNYEGCSCETSTYGCCPDMVTISKGSNYAGCPCDSLKYGCCPGSSTPAEGPNFAGCSCATTPFGCCPDGVTVAYGPKFEGCPSGPSLDTKLATEVCSLPKERGSCRNYTVKWYFDTSYGGCNRFWYGGCEGNGNRFPSQEQCERACVMPEGHERCSLPKIVGPCNATYVSWYFNPQSRTCDQFIYGGCLGNTNRFASREICEQSCIHHETLDKCDQPPTIGPCRGSYTRWYYSREQSRCKQFMYGGCKGNQNNYQSEEECRNSCVSQTPQEICALPKAEGPCLGNFPRWYYDYSSGVCREFTYSGCEGNKNRYVDKAACERLCNMTRTPSVAVNVCSLPKVQGPCKAAVIQWYYNFESKRCERFYYGGCEGNSNRFQDRESCEHSCVTQVFSRNVCGLPKEAGNCYDYRERWYYDVEDRRCHRFYYSGCSGNDNNFGTFQECNQRCGVQVPVVPTEPSVEVEFKTEFCAKPYDGGPCDKNEIRWFYDRYDGVCKEFLYGGCEGNENKFRSRHECETKCWNSQDICQLPKMRGTCSGQFTQWYYDRSMQECLEFAFSGCHGNANRFNSKETCDAQCRSRRVYNTTEAPVARPEDLCHQPYDSGPCLSYLPRWYYSANDNACRQFVYGGCQGNLNNFESKQDCEGRCVTATSKKPDDGPTEYDSSENVCRLQNEPGQCTETHARWFYDPESHTCLPFVYTGCAGNKNRFKTYELCMRYCSAISPRPGQPPHYPSEIKPTESGVECAPSNCEDQRCPFGIDEFVDERGCSVCRCSNPCYVHQCSEDKSCAVEVYRAENGDPRAQPVCRLKNKPGQCPQRFPDSNSIASECVDRCRTDADCRSDDKCCNNGCANVCVYPDGVQRSQVTTQPPRGAGIPYQPQQPVQSIRGGDSGEEDVITVRPGMDVVLDCSQSDTYTRGASWSKDGQPLYFVGEKMQLAPNGSLKITAVDSEDGGVYACSIDRGKTKYTRLTVHAPARILPGPQTVIAQLGLPTSLQCNAVGNPQATVAWWKGKNPLPLDSMQFHQYSNFTLVIRRVGEKDGGIYTCQAYNGIGPIALWDVTLLLDFQSPEIRPYESPSTLNGTINRDINEYNPNPENPYVVNYNQRNQLTTNRTKEPVTAEIRVASPEYRIGTNLQLECIVRGSQAVVAWFFNSDIPLVSDNRRRILQNNTLVIYNLTPADSGIYKCLAATQYNEGSASIPINVESTYVPPDCNDSPYFANCDLIVRARYCNNPHYAKFCCRSCFLAGQIDKARIS